MNAGPAIPAPDETGRERHVGEIFTVFLKLGLTSFGGPIAHIGYFHRELVVRRRWLPETGFADLVGLGQFLPGPASSQVGFAVGVVRGGWWGGIVAWSAFTLPSALAMLLFAYLASALSGPIAGQAIHGLKLVAVPIVAQALVDMTRKLAPDLARRLIAIAAAVFMLGVAQPAMQIVAILLGGLVGLCLCRQSVGAARGATGWRPSRRVGGACLAVFALLLIGLPIAASALHAPLLSLAAIFYRAGALVFGGGHVVLPLLRAGLVPHWVSDARFLAGYGAAQAMPGPLFTLASYLGAVAMPTTSLIGAAVAVVALSLPGLLLMAGALPFQAALQRSIPARAALAGINAAVIGILAAALYEPLWTTAVRGVGDMAVALVAFVLLTRLRWPPLAIVVLTVLASLLLPLV